MTDWQDIATAPRDGSEVLLFTRHDGDDFCEEAFTAVQIGWWDFGNDVADPMWSRPAWWHLQKIGIPTHWMPLPSPPREGGR